VLICLTRSIESNTKIVNKKKKTVCIKIAVIPHMQPHPPATAPYRSHNKLVEQMTLDMIS